MENCSKNTGSKSNANTMKRPLSIAPLAKELRLHAPFTTFGAVTGVIIMMAAYLIQPPDGILLNSFWMLHPMHVVLSALVTTGVYRTHSRGGLLKSMAVGYVGSIGIATLSDCVIPYLGEIALGLPNPGLHLGFWEKWWLVNPLALLGITIGYVRPKTHVPHAGHVLLSTWASLFHILAALRGQLDLFHLLMIGPFLFVAVWVPCCTSDIVFPLLFSEEKDS